MTLEGIPLPKMGERGQNEESKKTFQKKFKTYEDKNKYKTPTQVPEGVL